jgi:hypothetical protein
MNPSLYRLCRRRTYCTGVRSKKTTLSVGDCVVESLAAGQIRQPAAALRQLDYFVRRSESELAGQGSLQIRFQELAVPSLAKLEVQVHAVPVVPVAHGSQYRRIKANIIRRARRRGYPGCHRQQ